MIVMKLSKQKEELLWNKSDIDKMNQPNKPKTLRNGNKESLIKDQESISSLSRRKQALINNFKLRAKDEKLRRSDYVIEYFLFI